MWGSAPFQRLCEPPAGGLLSLALMPEWYLVIITLIAISALGTLSTPLLFALPVAACAAALPLLQAGLSAARAPFAGAPRSSAWEMFRLRGLTAFLHLLQPLARLRGRLASGLTLWRRGRMGGLALPRPRSFARSGHQAPKASDGPYRSCPLPAAAARGTALLAAHRRPVPTQPALDPHCAARAAPDEDHRRQRDRRPPAPSLRRRAAAARLALQARPPGSHGGVPGGHRPGQPAERTRRGAAAHVHG